MEKIKYIKKQDSGYKLFPGNSGETSINLSTDICEFLTGGTLSKGTEKTITFLIYRDDFVKAICFIISKLPLYKSSSKSSIRIDYNYELYNSLTNEMNSFFKMNETASYSVTLYLREDGRIYLKGLKQDTFSIRDFLVEEKSALKFIKTDSGFQLRILSGSVDPSIDGPQEPEYTESRIISDKNLRTFALKCFTYFSDSSSWNKIEDYIDSVDQIKEGDVIKVSKKGAFNLSGLFRCTTDDKIMDYNTPRRRWYTEPFTIAGKTVFLSTEWYPGPKADGTPYALMIPDLVKFIQDCFGDNFIYKFENGVHELWLRELFYDNSGSQLRNPNSQSVPFSISSVIQAIDSTGLLYDSKLIKRFVFSLMTKPFVILSGLAGSGKTQLAVAFAKALSQDESQYRIVSVGADWTNREPLLGFPNALNKEEYVAPENGVLQLLINANKAGNESKPYFLILDEMNLSYVERYFADFLSVMESHGDIPLWEKPEDSEDPTPASIKLPKNLFIIGTINVDETTYMFSPKVLDRANVIEFKISSDEMMSFLTNVKKVDIDNVKGLVSSMGLSFVELASKKELADDANAKAALLKFFQELKAVNAEFGYRSATEIFRFISQAKNHDDSEVKMSDEEILDAAIVQKLLPKLHGSRKKLEPTLKALWQLCMPDTYKGPGIDLTKIGEAVLKDSADKIARMYNAAQDNGFTSFAEA